jgi:hypothetical protein
MMEPRMNAANHVFSGRERFVLVAFGALALLACLFHATMSVLFVLPPNPISDELRPVVVGYTHPLFEQYWNVFAPTPIDSDMSIYARAKRAGASDVHATPWVDVSAPLLAAVRANRLSLYSTLKVAQMTLAVAAKNDKVLGRRKLSLAEQRSMRDPHHRPIVIEAIARLALYVAHDALLASGPADEVQIALIQHEYPRFTHRFDRDDPHKGDTIFEYGWLPTQEMVR